MPFTSAYAGCWTCGGELVVRNRRDVTRKRFCSPSCRARFNYHERGIRGGGRRPLGHFPPKDPRICEFCDASYQPNSGKQRWCSACVPQEPRWRSLASRYGVSKPRFEAMLAAQGGTCLLCERPATVVDHSHRTGEVRGLLCNGCNVALSRFEEVGWIERARTYAI